MDKNGLSIDPSRSVQIHLNYVDIHPDLSVRSIWLPSCDAVNGLRFALHEVVQAKSRQELSVLPKTVIFANSQNKVHTVCDYLRNCLLKSKLHGYTEKQVRDAVTTLTSHTADLDRQRRLTEFMKEDSQIRILVATTSFGMGMDVPDVEVVIQYEVIKQDTSVVGGSSVLIVCDLLQRIGRAARGRNRKARAYICINDSYWIPRNVTPNTEPGISASMNRNSRQSRQTEFEEDLRSVSGTETSEDEGYLGIAGPETHIADQEVDTVSFSWSEFAQMETCLRKYLLTFLGEDRIPERMRPPVPPEECCNVCNLEDLSVEGSFQVKKQEVKAPTKYSQRWLVLQYVQAWVKEVTRKWIGPGDLIYEPPIYTLIPLETQWQLSETFCLNRKTKEYGLSRDPKDGSFHHVKILKDLDMGGIDGIEDVEALCQTFQEFLKGQKEKILERLPRLKKEKEEDQKQKAEEKKQKRMAKGATPGTSLRYTPRLAGSEESSEGIVTFSQYESSLRRAVLLKNSVQQHQIPMTEGQQHSVAEIHSGNHVLIQEDDTTGSGQPLPEMEASAGRQAEGGGRDLQCALQGSRALADFTMGVGEQVTPIESVGDTLEDSSVSSQEVSRKNRSRRYMTRSLKVSANVPGKVGQQPCVPPTKSSQDEGREREKNKEKRQRSNTVTRIQSGMGKRVRS